MPELPTTLEDALALLATTRAEVVSLQFQLSGAQSQLSSAQSELETVRAARDARAQDTKTYSDALVAQGRQMERLNAQHDQAVAMTSNALATRDAKASEASALRDALSQNHAQCPGVDCWICRALGGSYTSDEVSVLRECAAELRNVRNSPHDADGHKNSGYCRACVAAALLVKLESVRGS